MASAQDQSDGETRAALIAAARTLAQAGDLSLKQVLANSGVSRAAFYRCFSGKQDLLTAIVSEDVRALGEISQALEPQAELRAALGGGGGVAVAAPADAWLERRLRVFERSLAALESRQEKSERDVTRNLALLDEKVAGFSVAQFFAAQPAAAPQPAVPEVAWQEPMIAALEEPAPIPTAPATPVFETPEEDPISEREIEDFIAHARVAAQRAAETPEPERGLSLPRWIAWMGVVAVTVLICIGLALGNVARATQPGPIAGIAYRQEPQDAMGRTMALADSGDPRAQTLVALAYLRGVGGVPADSNAAMRWSLAAARQGEPVAQYLIGSLYSRNDAARAFSWFEQAALHGNVKAMHNLAIAYAEGAGVAQDDRRAAAWFNRAAQQGYVDSQFDLAVLFERGQGVAQNRVAALKWYLIAAKGGDGPSQARGEELRTEMPADEMARAEAMAASYKPQPRDLPANAVDSP